MSKVYKVGNWWMTQEYLDIVSEFRIKQSKMLFGLEPLPERKDEETFYFVNLANSDDTIHTTGMKSRKTGKIFLCKEGYEIDLTKPIEDTDFHYVRDATSFDI